MILKNFACVEKSQWKYWAMTCEQLRKRIRRRGGGGEGGRRRGWRGAGRGSGEGGGRRHRRVRGSEGEEGGEGEGGGKEEITTTTVMILTRKKSREKPASPKIKRVALYNQCWRKQDIFKLVEVTYTSKFILKSVKHGWASFQP